MEQIENKKIEIPESIVEICRQLGKVAKDMGLTSLSGTFRPPWKNEWSADVHFRWEQGRHGEDANEISISSEYRLHTLIKQPNP